MPKVLRRTKTKIMWWITMIGSSAFITLIYIVIGQFRVASIEGTGLDVGIVSETISQGAITPWQFALVNLLFYVTAFLVSFFYQPSEEQEAKLDQYNRYQTKIDELQGSIDAKQDEKDQLDRELKEMARIRQQYLLYEKHLKDWIESLFQKSVSSLISECTIKRSDGIPDCFDNDLPELFTSKTETS